MATALFTILGIGLLIVIAVAAIGISLVKKGSRFLFKSGHHRHFSSSDYRYRGHGHKGHHSYGHKHYRHKHTSHSGFFSS